MAFSHSHHTLSADHAERMTRAFTSLLGLSVGDAFGETFFHRESSVVWAIHERQTLAPPWPWTDDTAMGLSVVAVLDEAQGVDPELLAHRFARRYAMEPWRGYGATAHEILTAIASGVPWRNASAAAFHGEGSMGNGSAMRVGPVGAYFADDLEAAARHARMSAEVTHYHPDAQAGAVAVAVAAAMAWQLGQSFEPNAGLRLIEAALDLTPCGPTHDGLQRACDLPLDSDIETAVQVLGNGSQVICRDTVPLCLWCAARHWDNYEEALWTTVAGLGDRDTTCAIVGSIVAMSTGGDSIPLAWREACEPLPH